MSEAGRLIAEYVERKNKEIIHNFLFCAEEIANQAKSIEDKKTFLDQTGNLRSSLGCIVAIDGKVVGERGFEVVLNGQEGAAEGKRYIRELLAQFPEGIVLLAVAGKNYAAYVSAKGLDVIDSAELLADKLVPMYLRQLGLTD